MFFYPIIYQDQSQGQYLRAGFKMKDSLSQYQQVIQPHSDAQYYVLITVGGLLLALVACFYIYYKFGRKDNEPIARERRDSEESHFDVRIIKERLDSNEKRTDAEINELWRAISKQGDQLLEIRSITGEIKGILSSRRSDHVN